MTANPRVLFGDDRSPGADLAWLWLHEQRWDGWDLVQLTATPPGVGITVPRDRSTAHPDPTEAVRTSFDEAGFHAHVRLTAEADPRVVLTDTSGTLVVVGATGHRFGPDRLGSTTDWLLRHADRPVVTARTGRGVHRILVCSDGSAPASRAAEAVAQLPWVDRAEVSALVVDDGHAAVDEAFDAVHAALDERTGAVREITKGGEPTRVVLDTVAATGADLVVLGTRGTGGLERLLLGSTAAAVVRHADASVLTCR